MIDGDPIMVFSNNLDGSRTFKKITGSVADRDYRIKTLVQAVPGSNELAFDPWMTQSEAQQIISMLIEKVLCYSK